MDNDHRNGDFPIKDGDFPVRYVELPDANTWYTLLEKRLRCPPGKTFRVGMWKMNHLQHLRLASLLGATRLNPLISEGLSTVLLKMQFLLSI